MSSVATMPKVRGRLTPNAPLAPLVWFKSGGNAEWLFEPADVDDLIEFLGEIDPELPVMALGLGSNLIVRDGGVRGVVVRLGKAFAKIDRLDETTPALRRRCERHPRLLDRPRRRHRGSRIPAGHSRHRRRLRQDERRRLWPRSRRHPRLGEDRIAFGRGGRMAARTAWLHLSPQQRARRRRRGRSDLPRRSWRSRCDRRRDGCDRPRPRRIRSRSEAAPAVRPSRTRPGTRRGR